MNVVMSSLIKQNAEQSSCCGSFKVQGFFSHVEKLGGIHKNVILLKKHNLHSLKEMRKSL